MNGHVEEMYGGHLIVKAFNHEAKSVLNLMILMSVYIMLAGRLSVCFRDYHAA